MVYEIKRYYKKGTITQVVAWPEEVYFQEYDKGYYSLDIVYQDKSYHFEKGLGQKFVLQWINDFFKKQERLEKLNNV
jgi:hypothetical protein